MTCLIHTIEHDAPYLKSLDLFDIDLDAELLACDIICDALLESSESTADYLSPFALEIAQTCLIAMNLPDFAPDDAIDADDYISTDDLESLIDAAMLAFDDPTQSTHAAAIRDTIRDNYPIDHN